ncbi:MAG: phosphodiester glycosidase family protein [Cytophagaceae bacterium]|nr:phosphodiester glycosidase family protein [Cytophagaceae bacterium]
MARAAESEGVSLNELIILLQSLKCKDAINFDGGGPLPCISRANPKTEWSIILLTIKKFDHQGERSVSNIFYIR